MKYLHFQIYLTPHSFSSLRFVLNSLPIWFILMKNSILEKDVIISLAPSPFVKTFIPSSLNIYTTVYPLSLCCLTTMTSKLFVKRAATIPLIMEAFSTCIFSCFWNSAKPKVFTFLSIISSYVVIYKVYYPIKVRKKANTPR